MLEITTVRTENSDRSYGRVLSDRTESAELTVLPGFTASSCEDVEILTDKNWKRGNVKRAERMKRRRAREKKRRERLDRVAMIGIVGLLVLALGLVTVCPEAKLLIGIDIAAILGILWRWLQ